MKKLLSILSISLIVSLLFTACAPKEYEAVNTKEYGCFYFPGTDWGMSEEQLLEKLDDEIEIINREEKGNDKFPSHNLTVEDEFLGREAYITYEFVGIPNTDFMPLQVVTAACPLNGTEFEDFKSEITELLRNQNPECVVGETTISEHKKEEEAEWFHASCVITGEKMITDLPQEIKDGYNNYIHHLYDVGFLSSKNEEDKKRRMTADYSIALNKDLSSVRISYFSSNDTCYVRFDGTGLTQPIIYAEAYAQLTDNDITSKEYSSEISESTPSEVSESPSSEVSETESSVSETTDEFGKVKTAEDRVKFIDKYEAEYGSFYLPEVPFGLTEEELYERLGKEASDFERKETESELSPSLKLITKGEFLGREAYITYEFVAVPNTGLMLLELVTFGFNLGETDFDEVKNEVSELLKPQNPECIIGKTKATNKVDENGADVIVSSCDISSGKMVSDLSQNIKDGYNSYIHHLYEIDFFPTRGEAEKKRAMRIDYTQTLDKELSVVKISHSSAEDACFVTFDNTGLIQTIIYAEAYAQLNK